jgi:hypothetical protein
VLAVSVDDGICCFWVVEGIEWGMCMPVKKRVYFFLLFELGLSLSLSLPLGVVSKAG